ncbi:MAG: carbamoyltransferase N-terminal domain-containing protein [Saprospiraceae bacterium]
MVVATCAWQEVALNCVANGKIQEAGLFKNIWVQPARLAMQVALWEQHWLIIFLRKKKGKNGYR